MSWKEEFPKENRYFETVDGILYNSDTYQTLLAMPDESVDMVVTSPPYWKARNYGFDGQIGMEDTVEEYIKRLLVIFDEVYRILKPTGTIWVNLADAYNTDRLVIDDPKSRNEVYGTEAGKKRIKSIGRKSLLNIANRFAIAMTERGWIERNEIIWRKPNAMPVSVKDRFTIDFEKIFFFTKEEKYYFEQQFEELAVPNPSKSRFGGNKACGYGNKIYSGREYLRASKGRNKRTVWSISTKPFKGAHYAVFPPEIPEICINAGSPVGGIVMDIFMGSGTTALVAEKLRRRWIGIDLGKDYCEITKKRILEQKGG